MEKLLIVVDMQNDFIDGSLGTAEAQAVVPKVKAKIEKCRSKGYEIVFTQDTHDTNYLETQEGKNLPVKHCIRGTIGWCICEALKEYINVSYRKETFGSMNLANDLYQNNKSGCVYDEIELIGLCTDICVISNAFLIKSFLPEVKIIVDASCCAGVTPESHNNALAAMKMCQISIINEEE